LGAAVLQELGVTYTGGIAAGKGSSYLISDGKKHQIPSDYSWIPSAKGEGNLGEANESQFFNSLAKVDFSQLESVTVQEWLNKNIHDKNLAEIIDSFETKSLRGRSRRSEYRIGVSPDLFG
jgi:hypothetical protein